MPKGNAFFVQILENFVYNIGFHIVEFVENGRIKAIIYATESNIGGLRLKYENF